MSETGYSAEEIQEANNVLDKIEMNGIYPKHVKDYDKWFDAMEIIEIKYNIPTSEETLEYFSDMLTHLK